MWQYNRMFVYLILIYIPVHQWLRVDRARVLSPSSRGSIDRIVIVFGCQHPKHRGSPWKIQSMLSKGRHWYILWPLGIQLSATDLQHATQRTIGGLDYLGDVYRQNNERKRIVFPTKMFRWLAPWLRSTMTRTVSIAIDGQKLVFGAHPRLVWRTLTGVKEMGICSKTTIILAEKRQCIIISRSLESPRP